MRKRHPKLLQQGQGPLWMFMIRAEQQIPFPTDVRKFYGSLFPDEASEAIFDKPVGNDMRMRNLRSILAFEREALIYLNPEKYFRIRFDVPYAAPTRKDGGFVEVPAKHPHRPAIEAWYEQANLLSPKLSNYYYMMQTVLDSTYADAWPELVQAVEWPKSGLLTAASGVKSRALSTAISLAKKEEVNEFIASTLLLPKPAFPNAWVGVSGEW